MALAFWFMGWSTAAYNVTVAEYNVLYVNKLQPKPYYMKSD